MLLAYCFDVVSSPEFQRAACLSIRDWCDWRWSDLLGFWVMDKARQRFWASLASCFRAPENFFPNKYCYFVPIVVDRAWKWWRIASIFVIIEVIDCIFRDIRVNRPDSTRPNGFSRHFCIYWLVFHDYWRRLHWFLGKFRANQLLITDSCQFSKSIERK